MIKRRESALVMQTAGNLVAFLLNRKRYALRLSAVERVLRSVAVTPLPDVSALIIGVVSMPKRVVPVVDLRFRLGLPNKDIGLSDRFLVARTKHFPIILVVDAVLGVVDYKPGALIPARRVFPNVNLANGVVCFADGLIYLHDLDAFLALEKIGALSNVSSTA